MSKRSVAESIVLLVGVMVVIGTVDLSSCVASRGRNVLADHQVLE